MRRSSLYAAGLCLAVGVLGGAASATDYSKRAAPITPEIRAALIGRWTNPVDNLVVEITDVDPVSGQIHGKEWPTIPLTPQSSPAGTEHDVVGWVNVAPSPNGQDHVVPVSFSTSLFEYGTLPAWAGFLRDGKLVTMHYLVWPNRTYPWDHISTYQETWTKMDGGGAR